MAEQPGSSPERPRVVGLIAGQGRLPVLTAQGIAASGAQVACVGLTDQYEADLPPLCDRFAKAGIIRLGRWIRLLRRWGVREAVMIGRVRKARMYQPLRIVRQMPDWRAAKLWYRVLRHDKRNAALLTAVADELAAAGIHLVDSTTYIKDQLAQPGVLGKHAPTRQQQEDADFAWPLLQQINELDIGQSMAVRDHEVIAVEAVEGTDALIRRAGELCRLRGWTLLKGGKAAQDMRFDVPTVGPQTIENMHSAGGGCLVLEAGRVILAEKERMLELADRHGIAVVGRGR